MVIRVKYQKQEEVKYVGHLDAMRTFMRCLKRTSIPVEYTKGFNPRMQISFALPLGVGVTTDLDYFDLVLSEKMNLDMFIAELNSVLPVGFKIIGAEYVEDTKKSLMSLVKEAKYEITIDTSASKEQVQSILEKDEMMISKVSSEAHGASAHNTQIINIKPYILDYSIVENDHQLILNIHSTAGSVNNLNPQNVINALKNEEIKIEDYEIKRKELII